MQVTINYPLVMNMYLASRFEVSSLRDLKTQIFKDRSFRWTHPNILNNASYEGVSILDDRNVEIVSDADFQKRLEKASSFQVTFNKPRSLMQRARL